MESNNFNMTSFYESYCARVGKMEKKKFKLIMRTYLKQVLKKILEGHAYNFGNHVGTFQIARFERNYKKEIINWPLTNKYKKQLLEEGKQLYDKETDTGEKYVVYYTDPYYYGYLWKKQIVKDVGYKTLLRNINFYDFESFVGAKRKLSANIDSQAIIKYELHHRERTYKEKT